MFGHPLTRSNLVGGKKHSSDLQHLGNMFIVFVVVRKKTRAIKTNEYFSGEADQEHKM